MNPCPKCKAEMINMFGEYLCHKCDAGAIAIMAKMAADIADKKFQEMEKAKANT